MRVVIRDQHPQQQHKQQQRTALTTPCPALHRHKPTHQTTPHHSSSSRARRRSPHHEVLPLIGELAGEEAGKVALDEAEDQHVAQRRQRDDQDDDEGNEGEQVARGAAQRSHLTRLERAAQRSLGEQPAWGAGWGVIGRRGADVAAAAGTARRHVSEVGV